MSATTKQKVQAPSNKMQGTVVGASVFTSAPTERLYEAVWDVRGFPRWAPGVRRVEVIRGLGEQGMLSEWEVSFLGLRKKIWSVLEEAVPHTFLRWRYDGPIRAGVSASCGAAVAAGRSPSSEPSWSSRTRGYGRSSTVLPSRRLCKDT